MGFFDSLFGSDPPKAELIRSPRQWSAEKWLSTLLNEQAPQFPTQQVAGLSGPEQMAQGMVTGYATSPTEGLGTLRTAAGASSDVTARPEVQAMIDEIMRYGTQETNRLGRKIQIGGGGRTSGGADMLGQSVQDTQRLILASLLPLFESAENRKIGAATTLAGLSENSMLNRINALSTTGALPRMLDQLGKEAQYTREMQQINFPYQTGASIANSILNANSPIAITGGEPSLFSQASPLLGVLMKGLF